MTQTTDDWLQQYITIVLRLNKAIEQKSPFDKVEQYLPPLWYDKVAQEPVATPAELETEAQQLADALKDESCGAERKTYLSKQTTAIQTVIRRLRGETMPLREEVRLCYDLEVEWTSESVFKHAHDLYEQALPGPGDVGTRLREWTQASVLPPNNAEVLISLMELSLREAVRRSRAFLPLPDDLKTEIRTLTDRPARAMARYLGHHRARIYFNPEVPFPLADLFYVMCHEGYPGHLAEFVLKDDMLIDRLGYLDETVLPPASPRFVISEGIALHAPRMIFAPGEEMEWLSEHGFPQVGMKPPSGNLPLAGCRT
jgi:hypothetical protein